MAAESTYQNLVNAALMQRYRVVIGVGAVLFTGFSGLDFAVYPDMAPHFLAIRIVVSLLLLASVALVRRTGPRGWLFWQTDAAVVVAGLVICYMIGRQDGVRSGYYQGLNLVFLAFATINSFRWRHILGGGLVMLAGYVVAITARDVPLTYPELTSAFFFMGSTLMFVTISTHLYAKQHRAQFDKSAQLDRANRQLRDMERLKDEFFANVSHELRTPLALVLGPARKLQAGAHLDEEARRDLAVIERNALLLLKHVNDLLDASKLDAARMTATYARTDLARDARLAAGHFEAIAAEKGIAFAVDAPPSLPATVDAGKTQRILFNLLGNAFKFTPEGGTVRLTVAPCPDDSVCLTVADDGPGVPEALREAIFERFRQGDGGDTRRFGGTGLGLAIARELAKLQRGTLEVRDAAPRGAEFVLRLPRHAPDGADVLDASDALLASDARELARQTLAAHDGKAAPAPRVSRDASRPRILVVEDNAEMNRFIADALAGDADVLAAFDGEDGLARARETRPDLIVTDVMMPKVGGEQLVEALRADERFADVPIVLLTAKADDQLRERLLETGAQDYLCKPFSVVELRARVRNLLATKRARDVLVGELGVRQDDLVGMTRALAAARKSAEDASRSKDEFLMNLSHELRTPLTAILGWADLLASSELPEGERAEALKTIERNARAQMRLVNDLLDMSRIVQGKLELELKATPLGGVVDAAVQAVATAAKGKGVALDVFLGPPDLAVSADADRLQQVVWNLLTNAVKFTPAGGSVRVHVARDGAEATLRVSDTGEGIEPAFLPHVFERLRQGDASTTKRHGGLGLGLAIVRYLVELHGGRIEAASGGPGKGSEFRVRLPAVAPAAAVPAGAEDPRGRLLAGVRVVVVDDASDTVTLIRTMLRPYGALVTTVPSADAARRATLRDEPHVLVADLGGTTPEIALTAAGSQRYLRKPVAARDLVAAIGELAGGAVFN